MKKNENQLTKILMIANTTYLERAIVEENTWRGKSGGREEKEYVSRLNT